MVVLLVMTMLGVSSLQTTVLEERMAGNLHDHNVAFQAAEAALQVGVEYLESQTVPPLPTPTGENHVWPSCRMSDDSASEACAHSSQVFENWKTARGDELAGVRFTELAGSEAALVGVAEQPRIYIEVQSVPALRFDAAAEGRGLHYYRVSALGLGGTTNARVILQTVISKVYFAL